MSGPIHMTLMIGPVIPVPVPDLLIDALDEVTVTSSTYGPSGFQLSFRVNSKSELNTIFLIAVGQNTSLGTLPLRVVLVVTLNGRREALFDGVVTNVELQPGEAGRPGTITVTGEDLTRVMDLIDFSGVAYPAMPAEARVALICAKYAAFGIIPLSIPSFFPDVPLPIERVPGQRGTDLAYIKLLAEEVGHVFYIEPGPEPLTNIAYFGPEIKVGLPQPALSVDMDAHTNVERLSFTFDPTKGVLPVVWIQNQLTRAPIPIPIPPLNPLQPPLGALPAPLAQIRNLKETAKMNPMQAISRGLAEAKTSQDVVGASGSLDVLRYGGILKARRLVGMRGVGLPYDGLYFVESVTSRLKRGAFKQDFSLTRNGLLPIMPMVPV